MPAYELQKSASGKGGLCVCVCVCGYWEERILLKIDLGQRLKSCARFRINSICTVVSYSCAL